MIGKYVEQYDEAERVIRKKVRIPLPYVFFAIALVLFFVPYYSVLINAQNWIPSNVVEILMSIGNFIYTPGTLLVLVLALAVVSTISHVVLKRDTEPKSTDYCNRTTVSWNAYASARRSFDIVIRLITTWWIYFFLIQVLLGVYDYTIFIESDSPPNNFASFFCSNLSVTIVLVLVNIIILGWNLFKALNQIEIETKKRSIKFSEIDYYFEVNSFTERNCLREEFEVAIFKEKYQEEPRYLLARAQKTRIDYRSDEEWSCSRLEKIPSGKVFYEVLDASESLSDIVYQFDARKERIETVKR